MNDLHFRLTEDTDLATLVRLRGDTARWMLAQDVAGQCSPAGWTKTKAGYVFALVARCSASDRNVSDGTTLIR